MPPLTTLAGDAQEALTLAKRAVPDGQSLTPELLLAAAWKTGDLGKRFPAVAACLPELAPINDAEPGNVPVAEPLRPLLRALASEHNATVQTMVKVLLLSRVVQSYLTDRGLEQSEIYRVVTHLKASPSAASQAPPGSWRSSPLRQTVLDQLAPWGTVLTEDAEPLTGVMRMDGHLHSLQKNLLKMRRPNALIIGQPGTGKTALVHEFARLIVTGDERINPALRDRDVFELSVSLFRAGSGIVGEYEKRVAKLVRLIQENPQIILFVDEIHQMLQSGVHESGPFTQGDQAFKQAIGRSAFSIIGATTMNEYAHYIQPDGALVRRFGLMRIEPPTPMEALEILRGRAEQFRRHYAPLRIEDPILVKTIELSEDLVIGRFQPDKALDILDEACAECLMHDPPLTEVTESVLMDAIEDEIGHSVIQPSSLSIQVVSDRLKRAIVGQDKAVDQIARGFVAGLSQEWLDHDGPRRVFFFCGPTGTGKTETAAQLASILGGGRESLIRIDCNTLMGSASSDPGPIISRLLGAPRGYVGYARGEGGTLSRIRELPESIVLFDEIEKASSHIGKLLLQILDEGKVEDSDGNVLDFRRSFIVFTTNAGTRYGARPVGFLGDGSHAVDQLPSITVDAVKEELRALGYGEEFLGRHLDFVLFHGLTRDAIEMILRQQLEQLRETARARGYALTWSDEIFERLLSGWTPRAGARIAFTILRGRVEEQLALAGIEGQLAGVHRIDLRLLPAGEESDEIGRARRVREDDALAIYVA